MLKFDNFQLKKKSRAIRQGVKSGSSALQGCLKVFIPMMTMLTMMTMVMAMTMITRPSILCLRTHQMMNYKWYLMVLGQYMTILAGTWSV